MQGTVMAAKSGVTGVFEIRLELEPVPLRRHRADVRHHAARRSGDVILVHGTVRWDDGHKDRELLPVDWFQKQ